MSLANKTVVITGGTRGIGLAIALRAAADGANVVILGKTVDPDPRLPGTLSSAAAEIEAAGGAALGVQTDIRSEEQVDAAVAAAVEKFGGIDVLVNNASAISLTPTEATPMKRYDLMQQVNARGTFVMSQKCIPHLKASDNPHILTLSPPLDIDPKWFKGHVAYTMAKMGMSMCTLGMAAEFADEGIAVNSLWPLTTIDTAAIRNLLGGDAMAARSRSPRIMADAAYAVVTQPSRECTGNFFIDELVLSEAGVTDFSEYSAVPGDKEPPFLDFFVPAEMLSRVESEYVDAFGGQSN
ncbi:MAG: NAD(P)-dependent oxidoreductase [Halieaceae bacterium]|nr:NAD(P)-dependent oxidoreductase [Halieaceae bacterium]